MKWEEVKPEQKDWQRQWNLTAYYGSYIILLGLGMHMELVTKTKIYRGDNNVSIFSI